MCWHTHFSLCMYCTSALLFLLHLNVCEWMSGFLMLLWAEKIIRHVIYLSYLSVCEK